MLALGCVLAGVAGALTAPIRGLNPWMGVDMLGIAFVVVALAGLGLVDLLAAVSAPRKAPPAELTRAPHA